MNLLRIGKIIVNLDHVTTIMQGDPTGSNPESLIVNFVNNQHETFIDDDAEGLKAFIERTVKTAVKPLKDLEGH